MAGYAITAERVASITAAAPIAWVYRRADGSLQFDNCQYRPSEADERAAKAAGGSYVSLIAAPSSVPTARPRSEWHEDRGNVVWWCRVDGAWAGEPAWIGTPLDEDWTDYYTHWTPHPDVPVAIANFDPSLELLGADS